nr:MAG TPA: hypothetical protein [Caudoviricetes sp.]
MDTWPHEPPGACRGTHTRRTSWVPFLLLTRRDVLLSIPPKLLLSTSRRPRNAKAVLISRPRVCPKITARS